MSSSASVGQGFRYLVAAATIAAFSVITLGGVVRVTGSGLGCPDWPLCYGKLVPPLEFHALVEYAHRLSVTLVSVLIGLAVAGAWWKYRRQRRIVVPLTLAAVFLVLQVVLGAVTVLLELPPAVVTMHLAVSQGLFAFLLIAVVLAWRPALAGPSAGTSSWMGSWRGPLFRRALVGALAVYVLTLSGSYVVGMGATGACMDWPLCGGNLLPTGHLAAIHMLHRLLVAVLGAVIVWAVLPGWRERSRSPGIAAAGAVVVVLLAAQVVVGAANPWLAFPPALRALHLALATALGGSLVVLAALSYGAGGEREAGGSAALERGLSWRG